ILHHAAAGLERRSAAGVAANPEQMITGAPRLDARAAGEVAAESAADAAAVWRKPEKRPVVRRIEGEPLGVPGELRPDQRKASARKGAHHQLPRLIERNAGIAAKIEHRLAHYRAADAGFAARAPNGERVPPDQRPIKHGGNFIRVLDAGDAHGGVRTSG